MARKKSLIGKSFKAAAGSRVFVVLWIMILLQVLSIVTLVFVMGRIGEPGTPVRFDGFSSTGIFLNNGTYLINFAVWSVIVAVLNIFISLKVYSYRGRQIALTILWFTIVLLAVATVFVVALLNTGNTY